MDAATATAVGFSVSVGLFDDPKENAPEEDPPPDPKPGAPLLLGFDETSADDDVVVGLTGDHDPTENIEEAGTAGEAALDAVVEPKLNSAAESLLASILLFVVAAVAVDPKPIPAVDSVDLVMSGLDSNENAAAAATGLSSDTAGFTPKLNPEVAVVSLVSVTKSCECRILHDH